MFSNCYHKNPLYICKMIHIIMFSEMFGKQEQANHTLIVSIREIGT